MNIAWLFFDEDGLLRSGWRCAVFLFGFAFLASLLSVFVLWIEPGVFAAGSSVAKSILYGNGVLMLLPALVVGWLCTKYLEKLPLAALGANVTARGMLNLGIGILAGAATLLIAILIALAFGSIRFQLNSADSNAVLNSLLLSFLLFFIAAAGEEALFRGYIFQTLTRSGYAWLAIALTAVFFGVVHIGNPSAGTFSTLNTVLAGIWFGIAYLKTRDLWFVTGLHFAWNWMQGSVLGIEVSGTRHISPEPLLRELEAGPAWITGGEYGLEAGFVTTIAIIASTAAIYFLPLKSEPPA